MFDTAAYCEVGSSPIMVKRYQLTIVITKQPNNILMLKHGKDGASDEISN